jgi:glycerol-3-phosphate cytidylyltransferase
MASLNEVSSQLVLLRTMQSYRPRVGIVASCFDLLHAGHYLLLKEAKDNCDILVVALQTDPTIDRPEKNKPVQSYEERLIQISGVKYVDLIVKYETEDELMGVLLRINPDIRFLGSDYIGKGFTGDNLEIPIKYIDRSHGFSTSDLRQRVFQAEFQKIANDIAANTPSYYNYSYRQIIPRTQ